MYPQIVSTKGSALHCFKNKFTLTYPTKAIILVNAPRGVLLHVQEPKIIHIKILIDAHNHKNSAPNSIFYTFGLLVNVHKQ